MDTHIIRLELFCICFFILIHFTYVFALQQFNFTIKNVGEISISFTLSDEYLSEIRGIFIHAASSINPNWSLIAQTAKDYGINVLVFELLGNNFARYPSAYVPYFDAHFDVLISEAHKRGIRVYAAMNVLADGSPGREYDTIRSNGDLTWTMCPTKEISRAWIKNLVEEVATKFNIDGFMFDYMRYVWWDSCYCNECQQKFVRDTGLTDAKLPDDILPDGKYYWEFVYWRMRPINELVRDIRNWMLAIKPNLKFSAAVWGWEPGWPTYNTIAIGQDPVYWIKEGYLDWVAPMMYTTDLNWIEAAINDYKTYMVAGPEGIVPLVPFLSTCWPDVVSPENFKQQIDLVRKLGCDGWIIWRYGGPGDGEGSDSPDIRNYLSMINLPPIFSLKYIQTSVGSTEATVTWITDLPTSTIIEYSLSPLFNASFVYDERVNFNYWDIDHVVGVILENSTLTKEHKVTITNLSPGRKYYFRVQSQGDSGIATSKVMTFTTTTS